MSRFNILYVQCTGSVKADCIFWICNYPQKTTIIVGCCLPKVISRKGHLMKYCCFVIILHPMFGILISVLLYFSSFIVRVWKRQVAFWWKSVSSSEMLKVIWISAFDYQMPLSQDQFRRKISYLNGLFLWIIANWKYTICLNWPCKSANIKFFQAFQLRNAFSIKIF